MLTLPVMTTHIDSLFENNRRWAEATKAREPGFFTRLAQQQNPRYMRIGCADSRVPANEITGLDPGEVFVHRNVTNVVVHSDLNALSTIYPSVAQARRPLALQRDGYGSNTCASPQLMNHSTDCHPAGIASTSKTAGLRVASRKNGCLRRRPPDSRRLLT